MASDVQINKKEESVSVPLIKLNEASNDVKDDSFFNTERANFEKAITETNFGKFNILLMLITMLPSFSQVFQTVSMSYVLPIAECDLNLTLEDKGSLIGITFAGMIASSFFWGYLCDTLGRRKIIVTCYFLVGFSALVTALSHNIPVLIISRFVGGFIINGPFAAATSYLSEFHSSKFRARIQMVRGTSVSLACVALPLLAWSILPWDFTIRPLGYNLHSWNVFLFFCSLLPFVSGTAYIFMPESPKFLMTVGKNEEALDVLQKVYRVNTGKSIDTYPIRRLVEETKQIDTKETTRLTSSIGTELKNIIVDWAKQMKPVFVPPHVLKLLLACSSLFLLMMSLNTLNLWLPQLFQEINDYQFNHNGSSSHLCNMLKNFQKSSENVTDAALCNVNLENSSVYTNAILVGIIRMFGFAIAGTFVNLLGKKTLLTIMATVSGSFATSLYFSRNTVTVLALASLHISLAGVCQNLLVTTTLEMFPTNLRTIALSMQMTSGRLGTVIGNIIFPSLLHVGCLPPFIFLGSMMFGCALLSFLYPNTENKPLE